MSALNIVLVAGVVVEAAALIAEHIRHTKRSYVVALEKQLAEIKEEKRLLLDRLLHVTTGAPLVLPPQEPETPLTDEQKQAVRKGIDKLANDTPFGGYPTMASLLAGIEAETFREDARDNWKEAKDGSTAAREEIVPGAALANDMEESEEDEQAVIARRKDLYLKTAHVLQEMKNGTAPVNR